MIKQQGKCYKFLLYYIFTMKSNVMRTQHDKREIKSQASALSATTLKHIWDIYIFWTARGSH